MSRPDFTLPLPPAEGRGEGSSSPLNQSYNVAVGNRTTFNDLFGLLRSNLAARGVSSSVQPIYRDFRAVDVRHSQAAIGKAPHLLGYALTRCLADHCTAQAIPWYVGQK